MFEILACQKSNGKAIRRLYSKVLIGVDGMDFRLHEFVNEYGYKQGRQIWLACLANKKKLREFLIRKVAN